MEHTTQHRIIQGTDGCSIFIYIWNQVQNPRGIIQIFHGMGEHAGRYTDFAYFCNQNGFIVYADDHRGHGKTAVGIPELGYLGEDGFNRIVEDEHIITQHIAATYPHLPRFIFGHSFGSFLAQEYLNQYSNDIHGIIFSGSALQKGLSVFIANGIATLQNFLLDDKKPARLIEKLAFGNYNKLFTSCSSFSWLSSDPNEVQKYEEDPYCGTVFPINFYYHLFKGFQTLYRPQKYSAIRQNIPILLIAGDKDPVGHYGKAVTKLYHFYKQIGLSYVSINLFKNKRHELLNETNKQEVYHVILQWLELSLIRLNKL